MIFNNETRNIGNERELEAEEINKLIQAAFKMLSRAYALYSHFHVGEIGRAHV